MKIKQTGKKALRRFCGLYTSIPVFLHELTHAVVAVPWVETIGLILYPRIEIAVEWRDSTPGWAIVLSHYAPLFLGVSMGIVSILYVLYSGYIPDDLTSWIVVSMLAVWWVIYTAPSKKDRTTEVEKND